MTERNQSSPQRTRPRGSRDLQRTGTIIAGGVGVVFLGVLGWYVMHAGSASAPPLVAPQGPKSRPTAALGDAEPGALQLSEGEGVQIDLMDKKDLRRQTGLLKFDSLEPLEARHFAAAKPEAWLYLNDGRTLHITAASGKLYMPDRDKEPESGTLLGGVVADLFEAREDGAKIEPGRDEPTLTFKSQTLNFDSTLGKMSTPDRVTIVSQVADFTGSGMEVLFNQVKQRLELCRIGAGDNSAVFHPGRARPKRKPPPTPTKETQGAVSPGAKPGAPSPATTAPKAPVETLYRMDFDQSVGLVQGTRKLDAEKLMVWARLIDGNLPDGAIAAVKGETPAAQTPAQPAAAGKTGAVAAAPGPTAPPVPAGRKGGDITLHWTGPCVIAPLTDTPPELKGEHIAARFTAPTGGVRLSDSERGASGRSGTIDYGATTGKLLLAVADGVHPRLEWPNAGTIETDRIEGDLTHGLIHIPAAGVLSQASRNAEVRWGEQADFTLVVRDGAVVGELKQATFAGGFTVTDKNSKLTGGFGRADFASTAELPNNLTRLIVNDKAVAVSEKSGRIEAGTLDVEFVLPAPGQKAGDPEPRVMTATDHVVVSQKDSKLTTDWLEAHLGRAPGGAGGTRGVGAVDVTSATAKGSVTLTRESDKIVALTDEMRADLGWMSKAGDEAARRQIVDLIGPNTSIKRGEQSTLTATQVRLDGIEHRVQVFGAGTFDHNDPQKKAVVTARWNSGMIFDDDAGSMECLGDARAISTPDPMRRDEIEADHIKLALTPGAKARPDEGGKAPERKLLRAEAIGSVMDREGGVNAKMTAERFSADSSVPDGRRREQLQYLEGARITADNEAGTLDVPGAGILALVDRKATERPAPDGLQSSLSKDGAQGDSLFNWTGSLHMDRASGRMDMHESVRLTHRALHDRQITNLDCTHLTAVARIAGASPTPEGTSLTSATATGAVYVTVGPEATKAQPRPPRKELVADRVEYDQAKGTLDATALPRGMVSMFDPERGVPLNATRLFWDLTNDRVEIKNLDPVTAPK